ncbi:unnamed protein product, partial [Pylaiella littoralis]
QVDEFVVATGADAHGVENVLNGVRRVSWAAGRTLRCKHVVLLAFAESASCRLTRAVLAASRHTTEANFVLVADGFKLDSITREAVENMLDDAGWRSFTTIEVPEFEGYSSAINRAVESIPGSSVVALLSTSALLLPASTNTTSAPAAWNSSGGIFAEDVRNNVRNEGAASDVFVAYERTKSSAALLTSSFPLNRSGPPSGSPVRAPATFGHCDDGRHGNVGAYEARYDQYGHDLYRGNIGHQSSFLLVTASPSRLATYRQRDDDDDVTPSSPGRGRAKNAPPVEARGEYDQGQHHEAEARPPPPQSLAVRLSYVAPLPLLVFDTETFFAMGELDERFAFQGGIAEWISRAKFDGCRTPGTMRAATGHGTTTGSSCPDSVVQHLHEREWGRRFVRSWPDERESTDEVVQSRGPSAEQPVPDARYHRLDRCGGDGSPQEKVGGGARSREGGDRDASGRSRGSGDPGTSKGITVDQWNQLCPEKLEALVQRDADLFFLPLLLSRLSPDLKSHDEADPVGLCVAFHSEWMGRAPDAVLVHEVLVRRHRFPVAVVIVVHDDISLMRATLEEAAVVVEHILVVVSRTPWNGDAADVSPTLELLSGMLEDVDSPTHGKLRVEVGSWASEAEQREHGNALIRDDPSRDFFRVVVMDTDEFWHPVELAKALVLVAQHPTAAFLSAGMDTYWASVRSVVYPPERLHALWLVDHHRCVWLEYRTVSCRTHAGDERRVSFGIGRSVGVVHHLSYVRVDEDLRRKMRTFSHAGEEQRGWYGERWLGWKANNSLNDLHPVDPEAFKRIVVQPLFRLTPALRTLHLDAKKGRNSIGIAVNAPRERSSFPSSASGRSSSEGGSEVHRDGLSQTGVRGSTGVYDDGAVTFSDKCFTGKRSLNWNAQHCRGDGSAESRSSDNAVLQRIDAKGCEKIVVARWTERQRTLCLIPD